MHVAERLRAARLGRRAGVAVGRRVRVGRGVRVEVARDARLEIRDGCVLGPGTCLLVRGGTVAVGAGSALGDGCHLVAHAGILVGERCVLGPQVAVMDAEHLAADTELPVRVQGLACAPVVVGDGAVLQAGAVLLAGATVAPGTVVGARTVTAMSPATAARPREMTDATPELVTRPEQPYLAIHCEITNGIRAAVDAAFPQLFGWLGQHGVTAAGPPLIRYRELDAEGEPLVVEVGAPVADGGAADGAVHAGTLPAGRYAVLVHRGPYTHEHAFDLADAQAVLAGWVEEQGLAYRRPSDRGWTLPCASESFRVGPVDTDDFRAWETELAYLVR
jgi:acetyltransferase-like isoleucine patch superfamily enzyme